ncbi:AAA+ ATPase domain-containing protein [Cynara cardunculus var. scolymus]|uniref:AAA+ ATPase domain-containing protein n=1 Tax=Cynara cardunculus var. scolymus TaxID=59895 RepID=A0A103XM26_CYNCS|nr:AAA+ ATPase domain-containing protein [Cynara cardunculus var. scolymus]
MEGSDIYKASSSLRGSSSGGRLSSLRAASTSLWRHSGMDVFSKSSRDEDDEEALKWASLEKLPTFDRLKKGLLFGSTGQSYEVDVENLGFEDRKQLLDRLVTVADEDNEKFLLKLRNRIDRHPAALTTEKYGLSKKELLKACTDREILLMRRNSFLLIMSLVTMTVFLRSEMSRDTLEDGGIYIGALYLGVVMIMFNGMSEISMTIAKLPNESDTGATELSPTAGSADGSNGTKKKGMILPFEPHSITFNDVKYSVDMPQEMKEQGVNEDRLLLLKSVSGAFRPGVLTALMGVSGAGKTTLMDVLAGRKTGGYIEGDIRISGYPKKQETFARISGYCEQNDIHSPHVTMFVEEVMELVELNLLRTALVGLPGINGLSTEQRKRLTIAVELVANPSIIFMDEPTSGLDARAAAIVMRTVRNTVDTGRTVVCTIHQPSIDIFEAFDEDINGVSKVKDGHNPATWMLEVSTSSQEVALGVDFSEIYRNSELFRRNKALIVELSVPGPGTKDLYFPTQYSQPFVVQCLACLWKQRWSYWRNPPYTAVRFAFTTFIGIMFGTMFWDLGGKRWIFAISIWEFRMDGSDIYRASNGIRLGSLRANSGRTGSLRASSTSAWRNSTMDVFSKSSREENDEEALKWAALEKLPTFDRLKKGLLFGSTGPSNEIDIDNLGMPERKRLLDRLVNAADEDNEKFLLRLRNRIDRLLQQKVKKLILSQIIRSRYAITILIRYLKKTDQLDFENKLFFEQILGLDICADTMVGDRMIRGEMIVGPSKVLLMDEISTGLDSSTTFQIVNSLKQYVHILEGTAAISLLQPAPETYDLFDDIILLSDGKIVYQGPRENVLEFFESMGFKCPQRKGVADFLQELTVMALITMTVFFRTEMHRRGIEEGGQYVGALFFGVVMVMFNGMAEISMTIAKLPVFYKQRDFLFYPTWAYALPSWIVKVPISFLESAVWAILTYYVIGFDPNFWRERKEMVDLGILGITNDPFFGTTLGKAIVKSRGLFAESYWYWIAIAALLGYMVVFNLCFMMSLQFLNPFGKSQGNTSNEDHDAAATELSSANQNNQPKKKGMVLPFEPHCITFDDIKYSVDMPQGLSGAFRPGVLTALMGVSGAGKTTLMDVLAGRKTGGIIDGDIRISGYPKKQETFARISGYCEQNDIHSPHVTVYESLIYSAWLRLGSDVNEETKKVMELVELKPLRDALVGLPGINGLSTEQRKRLTIAVELVANPSIIFMDEPTSGLDARAAAIVMRTVRNTVDTGRTVVCTIHQPSVDIFEAFDENLNSIFTPINQWTFSVNQDIEGVSKIKDGYNPATWMLEVSTSSQELALGVDFTEIYTNSELYSNPPYTAVRFAFTTGIGLMFGSIFWDLGSRRKTVQNLSNAMGSLYTSVLFIGINNASSVQPVVDIERTVFYRERAAGMYSALPYAFAQKIPIWWRWYYWGNPVAWTLYGLVVSQFGDYEDVLTEGETVKGYLRRYFGFKHEFLGAVAGVHVGLVILFAVIFAYCIKSFNFQKR